MSAPAAAGAGLQLPRLRHRPYLHLDADAWARLCDEAVHRPRPAFQECRQDALPGPDRLPRSDAAQLEALAFLTAVTHESGERMLLEQHLGLVLPSQGMELIDSRRGALLAAAAFAYDVLAAGPPDESLNPLLLALRRTVADQAERAASEVERALQPPWALEDAGAVATLCGLNLAGLALYHDEPDAPRWVAASDERLTTVLETVADDGWWPTGFDDWNLLLPLLVRVADAWGRLADGDRFGHGVLSEAWRVALHAVAPDGHEVLALDRVRRSGGGDEPARYRWRQEPCGAALDRLALRYPHRGFRAAAGRWRQLGLVRGSPWSVIWEAGALESVPPPESTHQVFDAAGVALWRSGWEPGAVWLGFGAGPAAVGDRAGVWAPRTRLHADANHFVLAAEGDLLAVDYGRGAPASRLHSTVLVDGVGQVAAPDPAAGTAELRAAWLSRLGGSLVAGAGGCYPAAHRVTQFDRRLALAPEYVLVWDQLASERRCRYDWLLQTQGEIFIDSAHRARIGTGGAELHVQVLRPDRHGLAAADTPPAGDGPPVGRHLLLTASDRVYQTQFLVLLIPARAGVAPAFSASRVTGETAVGARLESPDGRCEEVLFPTHEQGIVLDHLRSDGAAVALRRGPDGDWTRLIARRVGKVLVPGGEILLATQKVNVALAAYDHEVRGEVETATGATVTLRCPFAPRGVLVDDVSGPGTIERGARRVRVRLTAGRHTLRITG